MAARPASVLRITTALVVSADGSCVAARLIIPCQAIWAEASSFSISPTRDWTIGSFRFFAASRRARSRAASAMPTYTE
jgi:hypothetical protein